MSRLTQKMNPGPAIMAINLHDHASELGRKIPTDGIEDGAVTEAKLAANAVSSNAIQRGAVRLENLDSGVKEAVKNNIRAIANAPGFYSCDVPFYFYDKTVIASPNRLWLNIRKDGYLLEEQLKFDISHDDAWDTKATEWQPEHAYELNDYIYTKDERNGFIYRCTTAGKSSVNKPEMPKTLGATHNDGTLVWTCEKDYTVADNRAGVDFYIYACQSSGAAPKIVISANSTVPTKETAESSRKVGGFHCECLDVGEPTPNHWLKNFKTGDIIPFSVWDLSHRPASGLTDGMSWIPGQGWVGIYFASNIGTQERNLAIKFNGAIACGISTPQYAAYEVYQTLSKNKQKIADNEFVLVAAAYGTQSNVSLKGGVKPATTGGHVNNNDKRIVSNYGIEDCVGVMHSLISEKFWANNNYYLFSCGGYYGDGTGATPWCISNINLSVNTSLGNYIAVRVYDDHVASGTNVDVFSLIKERLLSIQGVLQ